MRKATATYNAPEGDAKSCTMNGMIFNDGEAVEINSQDHPHLVDKLQGNQHFDIDVGEEEAPAKRGPGRPKKVVETEKASEPEPIEPEPIES